MKNKKCKKCEIIKSTKDFYKGKSRGKNGQVWDYFDPYCKVCRLKYSKSRQKQIKKQAIEYLGGKCTKCGIVDESCIYDFHHLDPSKKELSLGKRGGKSFKSIKPELDKCILLCANCHRKEHSD